MARKFQLEMLVGKFFDSYFLQRVKFSVFCTCKLVGKWKQKINEIRTDFLKFIVVKSIRY